MKGRFQVPAAFKNLLKFALGFVAIWFLVHSGALDPALVKQALLGHAGLCVLALLTYILLVVIPAWLRWLLLIRLAGLKAPTFRIFSLSMMGIFFNSLIPGGTGGDLIKGYYLYKEHEDKDKALALTSIAMDRLIGLYALLTVAMAMTFLNYPLWKDSGSLRLNSLFYAGVYFVFTAAIAFFFSPLSHRFLRHPALFRLPGGRFLKSLFASLLLYRQRPTGLLMALGLGIIVDCGLILLYYFFALALELKLPLLVHGFVVPTLTMINGIPISPSGLGVGEAAGEVIYRSLGVAQGGSEVMALVHICIMMVSLIGAPFYFLYRTPVPLPVLTPLPTPNAIGDQASVTD
jgi:glycosyltransferase 2 family protein